ncbi:MAG: hypothetical protein ICV81_10540 [Flavisolibacter sp.]|nr:hypothetical protein [Flavisolibacter sp.]
MKPVFYGILLSAALSTQTVAFSALPVSIIGSDTTQVNLSPVHGLMNIKNDLRHESLKEVFSGLINLKEGKIGEIIGKFSQTNSNWVWKVKEGNLPKNTNALTIWTNDGAVTTLDYSKLKTATKLSVVRTMIHELVHAYLLLYFRFDGLNASKDYPQMVAAWNTTPDPDLNNIHHSEMATSFVDAITLALREYGRSINQSVQDSVYIDLAWGGLDFHNNNQLTKEEKMQIQQRLTTEQFGIAFSVLPVWPDLYN